MSITRLAANGIENAALGAVISASRITSTNASAFLVTERLVARPISMFAYGPRAISPYVSSTAVPPFCRSCTTFIDDEPISTPTTLPLVSLKKPEGRMRLKNDFFMLVAS